MRLLPFMLLIQKKKSVYEQKLDKSTCQLLDFRYFLFPTNHVFIYSITGRIILKIVRSSMFSVYILMVSFFFSHSLVRVRSGDPHDCHRGHGPGDPSHPAGEQRGDGHGEFRPAHRREAAQQAEAGGGGQRSGQIGSLDLQERQGERRASRMCLTVFFFFSFLYICIVIMLCLIPSKKKKWEMLNSELFFFF